MALLHHLRVEADLRAEGHLLERQHLFVLFFTAQAFTGFGILVHPLLQLHPQLLSGDKLLQKLEHLLEEVVLLLFVEIDLLAVGLEGHHFLLVQLRRDVVLGTGGLSDVTDGL